MHSSGFGLVKTFRRAVRRKVYCLHTCGETATLSCVAKGDLPNPNRGDRPQTRNSRLQQARPREFVRQVGRLTVHADTYIKQLQGHYKRERDAAARDALGALLAKLGSPMQDPTSTRFLI